MNKSAGNLPNSRGGSSDTNAGSGGTRAGGEWGTEISVAEFSPVELRAQISVGQLVDISFSVG